MNMNIKVMVTIGAAAVAVVGVGLAKWRKRRQDKARLEDIKNLKTANPVKSAALEKFEYLYNTVRDSQTVSPEVQAAAGEASLGTIIEGELDLEPGQLLAVPRGGRPALIMATKHGHVLVQEHLYGDVYTFGPSLFYSKGFLKNEALTVADLENLFGTVGVSNLLHEQLESETIADA